MTIYEKPKVKFVGGEIAYIELCDEVSLNCNKKVHVIYYLILKDIYEGKIDGILEVVPAYSSLTLFYDPRKIKHQYLESYIIRTAEYVVSLNLNEIVKPKIFKIPVIYGEEFGPDFTDVLTITKMSKDEFIKLHTSKEYICYMLGFTPGFIYLGDVDDKIAVPRLDTPRTKVPAGSVGIAGKQTGLYGIESPGGWRLIGRTPVKTFDYKKIPPIPIKPGDIVKFYPITREEYHVLKDKFIDEVQ